MQITSISILFLVSNDVNRNPNPNPHALYVFDPGVYIVQQLALSPRLAEKGFVSMCLEKLLSNSDIKSLIYQKILSGADSQPVCSGYQNLLLYPLTATSVCCILCNAVVAVPSAGFKQDDQNKEQKYLPVWKLINEVWNGTRGGSLPPSEYYFSLFYSTAICFDVKVHSGLACCIAQTTNDRFTEDFICHRLEDYKHAMDAFSCMNQANLRDKFPTVTEMVQLVCEGCHVSTSEERLAYNVLVATPSI